MTTLLPAEKTSPTLDLATAKVLLYGPPKVGKTTLAAGLNPDNTVFLATEAGYGGLSVFKVDIRSWDDFRKVYAELAEAGHTYKTVVVDTVDMLFQLCLDAACSELGVKHPADAEWGKGWQAVADKWRLGVGLLASLGMGVWFISHAKPVEIEQRVGKRTVTVPTVAPKARDFLMGFVDYIFFETIDATAEGEPRVLRTRPSLDYEAGQRLPLPDPIALPAEDPARPLREAMGGK